MTEPRTSRRSQPGALLLAFLLAGAALPAGAELARQGPVDPVHGYPQWYQDSTGLALDLCLPADQTDLDQGYCLLLPGDVPGGTAPETFPTNFADEHFWFAADAGIDLPNGGKASLVLAVEAAFGGGAVKAGDQISFGRIRVRIDPVPADGTYRVIHPYGELVFPNQRAGDRIFYTDDVGITCAQGDFSCALKTGIGPFLRSAATPGGAAQPFVQINGKTMLADPLVPTFVTGGPFSNKFRIEGPGLGSQNAVETELFTLMGRVRTVPIASPLKGERAGYTRNGSGSWVDVFASASAGIGKPEPALTLSGSGIASKTMSPDGKGNFWGQAGVVGADVPSLVQVTNSADVPPTVVDVPVTDQITVTEAIYDPAAQRLTVKAVSSDQGPQPPRLFLPDYGGLTCDCTTGTVVEGIAVPPKEVTVRSSAGGSATVPVQVLATAPAPVILPNISQSGSEDQPMAIKLAPATGGFQTGTFRILSQPAHGKVAIVDSLGNATYTPDPNYEGSDSFTYVVTADSGSDSNVATVSLAITPVNDPPVANPDGAATTQGLPVNIALLANDTDPDAATGIDPASAVLVSPPAAGSVSIADGVATYTPDATAAGVGTFAFTYRVADRNAEPVFSNEATVTVSVQAADNLSVTRAEYRANRQRWRVEGSSSMAAGQTVTVFPYNSATQSAGPTPIGTAVVGVGGAWAIDVSGSPVTADGHDQVLATSSLGGRATANLRVR